MTAVEHLGQALRALESEANEIEHRMSFVRAAIEAFGLDADSLLMDVIADEERADVEYRQDAKLRADAAGIPPVDVVAPTNDAPETAQQHDPVPPYGRTPEGRWDWDVVAREIGKADTTGMPRVLWLMDEFEVPATTAHWMVKRCLEPGLIDADRPAVNHQAARDAAAAAL